jgi:multisubunit Na+/H+ antiporter MnhG subunit
MGKVNGENVAGAAFLFLAGLFLVAGTVNPIISSVSVVFYIFIAAGVALVFLGYRTYQNELKTEKTIIEYK